MGLTGHRSVAWTGPLPQGDHMKEVFTPPRSHLRLGMLWLAFCLTMLILGVPGMFHDVPPTRRAFGMLCWRLVWSGMAVLAVVLVLAYFRESVRLLDGGVLFTHILGKRLLSPREVLRARWRYHPPSLKLFLEAGKEVVRFSHFPLQDRGPLMRYFRERVPSEVQEGWNDDLEQYATTVAEMASAAETAKLFRSLWWIVWIGPVAGAAGWLALRLYATHLGVEIVPTWTGSSLLDWTIVGTLVSVGLLASLRVSAWVLGPD